MLRANNLVVRAGRKTLLQPTSIALKAGECVAILGPNGAGKSTLLSCLSGERGSEVGRVFLDDVALDEWRGSERAQRIAVMPQSVVLAFPMKVWQVVALGRSPLGDETQTRHWQKEAMQTTGVWVLRDRLFPSLSGGEQQRVQLARVLVQIWEVFTHSVNDSAPRYLLLDECTSALDPAHQHAIMTVVKDFAQQGVGVCAVLHDISLAASWADRVVIMKDGAISAQGSSNILRDASALEAAYDLPAPLARVYAQQNKVWEYAL
jgi:iron complex transport system ATP-binding protein